MDLKQRILIFSFGFSLVFVSFVDCEAFSSTANLVSLVEAEQDLIPTLEKYINSEQEHLATIKR